MDERYLIVSLGSIGRRHLGNLRMARPAARIGVLRLKAASGGEPLPPGADEQFYTMEAALAFRPRVAFIASPASAHLGAALPLVRAGVPVFVEKPLADALDGTEQLLEEAQRHGVPVMTGYNLRFLPSLREARRLVQDGAVGTVLAARAEVGQYLPDWRPASPYQRSVSAQRALGGGALLELSHELDYLYWMFGMPSRVGATGGCYSGLDIDVEDMVELTLEYARPRRLVSVHLDFLQRSPSRTCKFIGSEGTLIWNGLADSLDLYTAATGRWERREGFVAADRNLMYVDELSHFLRCVEEGGEPLVDGRQGRDVLRIVEAARASMAGGGMAVIP